MKNFILLLIIGLLCLSVPAKAQNCQWKSFDNQSYFSSKQIEKINMNSKGWLVLATEGRIYYTKDTIWDAFSDFILPNDYAVCIDEEGDVYAGDNSFGFIHYDIGASQKHTFNDTTSNLLSNDIKLIKQAPDSNFWLSVWGKGVSYWDGDTFINYQSSDGLCDSFIHDIAFWNGQVVFAGFNGKLSVFDGSTFTNIPKAFFADRLTDISIDEFGNIWAITYQINPAEYTVAVYDGSDWSQATPAFAKEVVLTDIAHDAQGFIWLSSLKGLAKFDWTEFHYYDHSNGLLNDSVYHLNISKDKSKWFSSIGGINRLKEKVSIAGQVYTNASPATNAYVKLYQYIPTQNKKLNQLDSVVVNSSGEFEFPDLEPGDYILFSHGETQYAATYFGNTESWMHAQKIEAHFCDSSYDQMDIQMIEFFPIAKGNGHISGKLISADGTRATSGPIKDVDVTLKKVPGGVVKVAKTNQYGIFEFNDLDSGAYSIIIDIPGLKQDSVRTVKISETDSVFNYQDYEVDSLGIHLADFSSMEEQMVDVNLHIYPNPARHHLYIDVELPAKMPFTLIIQDIHGKVISRENYSPGTHRIIQKDMTQMTRGIYFITVQTDKLSKLQKLMIY
jgi:hypothetical protein